MKIIVIGHGRHGKDEFCERLGLPFESSSMVAAEEVVFPLLINMYPDAKTCFEDRHNHRALWFTLIQHYNAEDKAKLGRKILAKQDVYCGVRDSQELRALQSDSQYEDLLTVWIDASKRVQLEDESSINVTKDYADVIIKNNGTLEEFHQAIAQFKHDYRLEAYD